jgi:hypothetical protein
MSTQSELAKSSEYTEKHVDALIILDGLKVHYVSETFIPIYGEFDAKGRPVYRKPDVLIHDGRFGSGVILIDGDEHERDGARERDEETDELYRKMHLWVEHLKNRDVCRESIERILSEHARRTDDSRSGQDYRERVLQDERIIEKKLTALRRAFVILALALLFLILWWFLGL